MNCPYCGSDNIIYHDTCIDTDTYWCDDCNKYFDAYQKEEINEDILKWLEI